MINLRADGYYIVESGSEPMTRLKVKPEESLELYSGLILHLGGVNVTVADIHHATGHSQIKMKKTGDKVDIFTDFEKLPFTAKKYNHK